MDVTPETIAVALGRTPPAPDSAEFHQWSLWISDALLLIEARLGDPAELDQGMLDYVVREAVVAQVRRPDDATAVDISVDDGRVSRTYRTSSGRVTILDEWWRLLSPSESGGAFSIIPTGSRRSRHLCRCSLFFGVDYCSCGVDIAGHPLYRSGTP